MRHPKTSQGRGIDLSPGPPASAVLAESIDGRPQLDVGAFAAVGE
jgi:hypothetical protein